MGKTRKKHRSRKRRDNGGSNDGSSSGSDLDENIVGKLKPIGAYLNNRVQMVSEMFEALRHGNHLLSIMPDVLKSVPLDELRRMCVDELEGMSKKRIRCILAGAEMASSSGTEDTSTESEEEADKIPATLPLRPCVPGSNDQQQNSASAEVATEHAEEQQSLPAAVNVPEQEADDFGLEEPYMDIILGEPSPVSSPADKNQEEQEKLENDNEATPESMDMQEGAGEYEKKEEDTDSSGDAESSTEDDDETEETEEEAEKSQEMNEEQHPVHEVESDLEDGELPESPARARKKVQLEQKEDTVNQEVVGEDKDGENSAATVKIDFSTSDGDTLEVQQLPSMESSSQVELSANVDDEDSIQNEDEDDDGDDGLVAEIQAQEAALFGESVERAALKELEKPEDGQLEFVEEPISKSSGEENSGKEGADVATSFTWCQQGATRPKILDENEEEGEKEAADDVDVEPYDDEGWSQDTVSPTQELLPPGFEPPRKPSDQDAIGAQETPASAPQPETRKATSILPIRTLYNQLKQHRMATAKKQAPKPKVYGPSPWKREGMESMKAAGPELPPATSSNEEAPEIKDTEKEKPKKPKKKSDVLTPEFLTELERKRMEHDREMKEKMELLENLKAKRQKVATKERDMEEEMKKKLELGLFDMEKEKTTKKKAIGKVADEDVAEQELLDVDPRKSPEQTDDVDEDYLLIISDEDNRSDILDKADADEDVASVRVSNENLKFSPITISVSASTSGKMIRSVSEKTSGIVESIEEDRSGLHRGTVVKSSVGLVEKTLPKKIERSRSRSRSLDQTRSRNRRGSQDRTSRSRSRSRNWTRSRSRSQERIRYEPRRDYGHSSRHHQPPMPNRRPSYHDQSHGNWQRYERMPSTRDHHDYRRRPYISDRRMEKSPSRSRTRSPTPETEPAPTKSNPTPAADESFQRQAELLELELRAKAIRSLMKVQDETKEDA